MPSKNSHEHLRKEYKLRDMQERLHHESILESFFKLTQHFKDSLCPLGMAILHPVQAVLICSHESSGTEAPHQTEAPRFEIMLTKLGILVCSQHI